MKSSFLKSTKILDFTRLLPGPFATQMLAEMGLSVLKVESPKRLDYAKLTLENEFYESLNNAKTSLVFDYEKEKEQIYQLIRECDVLIEQFRPGAMDAWGLGFEKAKTLNPNIIYVSITGYGQTGALKDVAGHDINYMAKSGLLKHFKDQSGKSVIPGIQIADLVGGSYTAVVEILAALLRKKNGEPGAIFIDISMTDAIKKLAYVAEKVNTIPSTPINDVLSGGFVNYNLYECSDGKWVAFGGLEIKFWKKFATTIGKHEWAELGLMQLHTSVFNKKEVELVFKTKTADEWDSFGKENDVCITRI